MEDKKYLNPQYMDSVDELSLDDLDGIAGGKVDVAGYAIVLGAIKMFKKRGVDKDFFIQDFINGWNQDSEFRQKYTDGTDEDLQDLIDYIDRKW